MNGKHEVTGIRSENGEILHFDKSIKIGESVVVMKKVELIFINLLFMIKDTLLNKLLNIDSSSSLIGQVISLQENIRFTQNVEKAILQVTKIYTSRYIV